MRGKRILVVDDDASLRDMVAMVFTDAGFEVEVAADGRAGLDTHRRWSPDLVLLDLVMPELDGLEVCRTLRATSATPIVMLTSKDDEVDKIVGLEMGADDYVTKPFSARELVARVRAVLRRAGAPAPTSRDVVCVGSVKVDRTACEARVSGTVLTLTRTELDLLYVLVATPNVAHSRDRLIDEVYGVDIVVAHRTIDTFVKRLRKKIREAAPDVDPIETVRSVGYRYRS